MQYDANNKPYQISASLMKKKLGKKMMDGEFYAEIAKQGGNERRETRKSIKYQTKQNKPAR